MDWETVASRPGSFSKNFGWNARPGLALLHEVIVAVFYDGLEPVRREDARRIISDNFSGDPLVPLNFFFYNRIINASNYVVPDQLVLQALAEDHSEDFDYLAISALNFSRVGVWHGARPFQSYPAPWARSFVIDVLYEDGRWNPDKVQADTIENFLDRHLIHKGDNTRKFATNLNFIYQHSGVLKLRSSETESWWGAAVFLFLDRAIMDGEIDINAPTASIIDFLDTENFWALTAVDGHRARYAAAGIIDEYRDLGGLDRLNLETEDEPAAQEQNTGKSREKHKSPQARQSKDLSLSPVQRVFIQAQRQVRNRANVIFMKAIYEDECAVCGVRLEVDQKHATYSEAGHIKPIGDPINGPDHLSNLLLFCPNHHKCFDHGGIWIDPGRRVIRSAVKDKSFDQRNLLIHKQHDFDLQYAEWHAGYFGHIWRP